MALAIVGGVATAAFATVNAAADTLTVLLLLVDMVGLAVGVVVVLATVVICAAVVAVCVVLLTVEILTITAPKQIWLCLP